MTMSARFVFIVSIALAKADWQPSSSGILRGVDDYQAGAAALSFNPVDLNMLNLTGYFTVPPKPYSWDGDTQVYLWFGVNWYDSQGQCMGVMQPVLTYGCSPNAMSGVGCGTDTSDPHYADDPYWYFSSQYVIGWGPGQAFGSTQVIKTKPGSRIYSEMSYNPTTDSWVVIGRDDSTGETSTFDIAYPMQDSARSWRAVHADPGTQATLYAVSEPHQVSNAAVQMPPTQNFEFSVVGPSRSLYWAGGQGSARLVQQGDQWKPTLIDMDLTWPDGPTPAPIPVPTPVPAPVPTPGPAPIPSKNCPADAELVNGNECLWKTGAHGLQIPGSAQAYCNYISSGSFGYTWDSATGDFNCAASARKSSSGQTQYCLWENGQRGLVIPDGSSADCDSLSEGCIGFVMPTHILV